MILLLKEALTHFERYAEFMIDKYQIPGISLGINHLGERRYYKGFGYRDIENKLPVTEDTIFGIASITKSFTCVAIMQLQEAGKLSVHDPVIKYLPEFRTPDQEKTKKMTIHHFMTHTSSLPPLPRAVGPDGISPVRSHEEFMQFIGELEFDLLGEPGEHFSYSNHAFNLLGTIIERVSGQSYNAYIAENILQPCGMENTLFRIEDATDHHHITTLYEAKTVRGKTIVYPLPDWGKTPFMTASGFLRSTVKDMLKYAEIFRNNGVSGENRILSYESVQQMTEPYVEIEPGKFYGYGLMITPNYYGHKLIEHSGSLDGVSSRMCVIPEVGLTGVILTNLSDIPAGTILMSAVNDAMDRPVTSSHVKYRDHDLDISELEQYVGTYESDEGMKVTIDTYGKHITIYTNGSYHPIRYIGNHTFLINIRDQEETIRFIFNDQGQIDRLAFHYRQLWKVS